MRERVVHLGRTVLGGQALLLTRVLGDDVDPLPVVVLERRAAHGLGNPRGVADRSRCFLAEELGSVVTRRGELLDEVARGGLGRSHLAHASALLLAALLARLPCRLGGLELGLRGDADALSRRCHGGLHHAAQTRTACQVSHELFSGCQLRQHLSAPRGHALLLSCSRVRYRREPGVHARVVGPRPHAYGPALAGCLCWFDARRRDGAGRGHAR